MKKMEKIIAILALLYLAQSVCHPSFLCMLSNSATKDAIASATRLLVMVTGALHFLIGSACAVWMFVEARQNRLSPWVWFAFGFAGRINAIIIFYVYAIYCSRRRESAEGCEQSPPVAVTSDT